MTRYLHRLIERATGQQLQLAATASGESRNLVDDPFERVAEMPAAMPPTRLVQAASPLTPTSLIEPAPKSAPIEPAASAIPATRDAPVPASVTRVEHAIQLAPPPAAPARVEPQATPAPINTPDFEGVAPPPSPSRVLEAAPVATTALRPAVIERETVTEKWLAPEPPAVISPPPSGTAEPERAVFVPTAAPVAAVPPPRPIEPVAKPAVAAVPDSRPALTIGRLVVEVRQQAPAPAPAPVIVRAPAPTASTAPPSVLHRGFGLGQS